MRPIDADMIVHWQSYDDEHETFPEHTGTIADFLDQMTDEGCPETVDAVPVRRGKWIYHREEFDGDTAECSVCHVEGMLYGNYCPNCGAKMGVDGK